MGMKVAAVSVMCQDERVFQAMEMAGTPCPFMGQIGPNAAAAWATAPGLRPDYEQWKLNNEYTRGVNEALQNGTDPAKVDRATKKDFNVKEFFMGLGAAGLLLLIL